MAALAILAYLPLFTQPLLQDDYPNIEQARLYGPVSKWPTMVSDPVFRYRVTTWVLTYWTDRLFDFSTLAFYCVSIGLHVVNTWLLYAMGTWGVIGWRVSAAAAAFFAVYEGHQEAVMWYSASNELLLFLFGMLSLLCWVRFLQTTKDFYWYAISLACFVLALASKESAVVMVPLLLLPLCGPLSSYRRWLLVLPFVALALADIWLIFEARSYSFRFQDGSFSLHAPVWITWPRSFGRLLWFWGLLGLLTVFSCRAKQYWRILAIAGVWVGISLLPYSFLTYMHFVPSRQTYLASVGLSWIVAAGFWTFRDRFRQRHPTLILAVVVIFLLSNIGYLWTRKRRQFLERAAPTEALVAFAQKVNGPIYVRCFPYAPIVAEAAIRLRTNPAPRLIWQEEATEANQEVAVFCWDDVEQDF